MSHVHQNLPTDMLHAQQNLPTDMLHVHQNLSTVMLHLKQDLLRTHQNLSTDTGNNVLQYDKNNKKSPSDPPVSRNLIFS